MPGPVHVTVSRIGGIEESDVDLEHGVNVLTGRNATNRTSFLQALQAAMGSRNASLKGDAESGQVEVDLDDTTYTRVLERSNGGVSFDGDPYLDDPTVADLFAFLLEDNDARQAVATKADLREVLMRPVDTADIRAEIQEHEAEKRRLDDEIAALEEKHDRVTELEAERARLEDEIASKEADLADAREALEAAEGSVDESREAKDDLDEAMAALQDARSDLEDLEFRLETERETLAALRSEREELTETLEDLPEAPAGEVSELESKLERLRGRREAVDSTVSQLQRIIQFNDQLLAGDNKHLRQALDLQSDGGAVTDQLVEDTVVCWTCGSEVERSAIESTVDQIRTLHSEKVDERGDLTRQISDVKDEMETYESQQRERRDAERRLERTESEIEEREPRLEDLEAEREALEERIETLTARVDDLEAEAQSDVLSAHKTVNQLEFERDRLERELDRAESTLDDLREELDREDALREEREAVQDALVDLRTRVEQLETGAVEAFNEHMQSLLDLLAYENLDRVWIERTEQTVREGRRTVTRGAFDLHVVRRTEDGAAYEDTVDHLSESEREVIGLVFALAGYLVHDVHETVPFMLLDSLEAIDSERIAALVDYFEPYPAILVVALLEEDAQALDPDYHRVTDI